MSGGELHVTATHLIDLADRATGFSARLTTEAQAYERVDEQSAELQRMLVS